MKKKIYKKLDDYKKEYSEDRIKNLVFYGINSDIDFYSLGQLGYWLTCQDIAIKNLKKLKL